MKLLKSKYRFLLVLFMSVAAAGQTLAPWRERVAIPVANVPTGEWNSGLLITHGAGTHGNPYQDAVAVYRVDGSLLYSAALSVAGASQIRVIDAQPANSAGSVIVSAQASTSAGQWASLLCFLGPNGATARIVRTNPFLI